jgi:pre-mRNA-processing factor 8
MTLCTSVQVLVAFTSCHGQFYRFGRALLSDQLQLSVRQKYFRRQNPEYGHPQFEPLYRDMNTFNEDWSEFNDIGEVNIRQQICMEYKVAFSHLYNSLPLIKKCVYPYR